MEYREEEEAVFNLSGNWFGQPLMTSTKETSCVSVVVIDAALTKKRLKLKIGD